MFARPAAIMTMSRSTCANQTRTNATAAMAMSRTSVSEAGRDDAEHRGLQDVEGLVDGGHRAERDVRRREDRHHDRAGQDERDARDDPAERSPGEVAHVDRELQRLRPGQDVADAHDPDEPLAIDPPPPLDDALEQHRDLRGRAADVHEAEPEEVAEHFAAGRRAGRLHRRRA
jgi:hypothetical protein